MSATSVMPFKFSEYAVNLMAHIEKCAAKPVKGRDEILDLQRLQGEMIRLIFTELKAGLAARVVEDA